MSRRPTMPLGYEITVISGRQPADLTWMTLPARGPELLLYFSATDRAPFELTLELRAVDLNGNLGPATLITVDDPGDPDGGDSGGCATTMPAAPPLAFALSALLIAVRRRRVAHIAL